MYKMHVIDIFTNIAKIKRSRIKDGLQYTVGIPTMVFIMRYIIIARCPTLLDCEPLELTNHTCPMVVSSDKPYCLSLQHVHLVDVACSVWIQYQSVVLYLRPKECRVAHRLFPF